MGAPVTCRRIGSKYTTTWPGGRTATGYTVLAEREPDPDGRVERWTAGFITQVTDNWGRKRGWIVLDTDTGVTIFGAGESTRIGNGLGDCLYLFADRLQETST